MDVQGLRNRARVKDTVHQAGTVVCQMCSAARSLATLVLIPSKAPNRVVAVAAAITKTRSEPTSPPRRVLEDLVQHLDNQAEDALDLPLVACSRTRLLKVMGRVSKAMGAIRDITKCTVTKQVGMALLLADLAVTIKPVASLTKEADTEDMEPALVAIMAITTAVVGVVVMGTETPITRQRSENH